jgi:hypothetical protein
MAVSERIIKLDIWTEKKAPRQLAGAHWWSPANFSETVHI